MSFLNVFTRSDTIRVRSDLTETFKIMNGLYDVNREMFFKLDVSGRRGHNMKLFNEDLDLMSGNLSFVTELLIIGMYCHNVGVRSVMPYYNKMLSYRRETALQGAL